MAGAANFADRRKKKTVVDISEKEEKATATQLPVPCGFKLLIALPEAEDKTEGGLYKAEQTKKLEEVGSVVGFVHAMGPDAYTDKKRCSVPYCKVGDWIIMRAYAGTRLIIHGTEWRLINDDSVDAVVQDPRGISKA